MCSVLDGSASGSAKTVTASAKDTPCFPDPKSAGTVSAAPLRPVEVEPVGVESAADPRSVERLSPGTSPANTISDQAS